MAAHYAALEKRTMNMKFSLSGIDDQSNEFFFGIEINKGSISFTINNNPVFIKDDFRTIIQNIDDYNKNYGEGEKFYNRLFFKYFSKYKDNICVENLIRTFAVSSAYFRWYYADRFNDFYINSKIETMKENFYNRLLIDWTGDLDVQPQMFFIQKELIDNHLQAIESLYNLRLLQKFSLISPKKMVFYYVPFVIPEINNLSIIGRYSIWRQIIKGINAEVLRLTGGRQ